MAVAVVGLRGHLEDDGEAGEGAAAGAVCVGCGGGEC